MIRIYGHPLSTCTRKVLMTLAETNTPYELSVVDFAKGEHKQPAHLARQPFGQVPAMDDDGFTMFESRAICRYLNRKANGSLIPTDAIGAARMEQWVSIETTQFSGPAMKFIFQDVFKRPQTAEVLEEARQKVGLALGELEKQLSRQQYLAGNDFSLADLCFMPYLDYGMATEMKASIERRPKISAWWKRISERPSWQKVIGKA